MLLPGSCHGSGRLARPHISTTTHSGFHALTHTNLINSTNGQYHSLLTIPLDNFPRATNGINSSVFADNTGRSYFNLNGGVGRVDIADAAKLSNFKPGLEIAYAGFMSGSGEQIALPGSTDSIAAPEVRQGNFRIVLQYPEFDHRPLRYRFTLDNGGRKIQKTLPVPEILYPTLSPGNYIVLCEVLDENGAVLGSIRYKFMVPRPWPLRWWAIIIYLILICVSGYSLARYYARRRLRQERANSRWSARHATRNSPAAANHCRTGEETPGERAYCQRKRTCLDGS